MDQSDTDLVTRCLNGHREAFSELVVRHQHAIFNLAYRMTNNHPDAADLAQEAFIRAFQKLYSYKPAYSFRNWVMGICANLARNRFRSETRRRTLETRHVLETVTDPPAAPDPRHALLEQALARLPEQTRVPLVLKYMEDLSLEDIARTLRLGLSAVKMRLMRGREELLNHIRQLQSEEGTKP
jgi:RNA polymerase sigma-70 factor (ECF subfamily)